MANYDLTYEGSRVQGILDTGNSLKDAGYIFRGEATPSTVPGTPTERVAYIGGPGTYTNFGSSITVGAGCICVFKYTGSAWSNQVINTGLSDAISSEATTRSEADTALQNAINAINNNIGNGYVYAGVATPSTSPVTGKVFYLAVQAGTYTNFGNAVVTAGLNVIKYNGSAWSVDQVIAIDAEPTQGSANLVKSGGVLNSIIQNGPAFDLSAYNAQGGTLATYADLSAALTALNALPADFKKGGMSFKFVLTSDNKYVQYRFMLPTFNATQFATVSYWQGVDTEPKESSHNLVESGGVYPLTNLKYYAENVYIKNAVANNAYWRIIDWPSGTHFKITNNTNQTCSTAIYNLAETQSLQTLGVVAANSSREWVLEVSGPVKVLLYPNGNGELNVERTDKPIPEMEKDLAEQIVKFNSLKKHITESVNLFNVKTISEFGWWCNYTDGVIESTQYVTNYAYSEYIPVKPSTEYTRNYGTVSTVFFNAAKQFLGGTQQDTFTTPSTCAYVIVNVTKVQGRYLDTMLVEGDSLPSSYFPYYYGFEYPKVEVEKDYITVGVGGEYPDFIDAFSVCQKTGKYMVIMPGEYDLVSMGIAGTSQGFIWPHKIVGYGATLLCHLTNLNSDISPIHVSLLQDTFEVYGLTIDASNCRYCIHDEMGGREQGKFYRHVYKDLHLIHNSEPSTTWVAPQCIGGGLGDFGYIEIYNCVFEAKMRDVSYHSLATTPQREQTGECEIKITNCYFSHMPSVAQEGGYTTYMNKMYVSGCSLGEALINKHQENIEIIDWSNEVRQ